MSAEDWEIGYEVGYREGESSGSATWELILDEDSPMEVAQRLAKLRAACEALVAEERIYDYLDCALCDAPIDRKSQANGGPDVPLERHRPDCPWRMAKEALA